MKVITVAEAQGRLPEIIYAVMQGESIVLKDGDREVALSPRLSDEVNLIEDSEELEAELLRAAQGKFKPHCPEELTRICEEVIRERRASK